MSQPQKLICRTVVSAFTSGLEIGRVSVIAAVGVSVSIEVKVGVGIFFGMFVGILIGAFVTGATYRTPLFYPVHWGINDPAIQVD